MGSNVTRKGANISKALKQARNGTTVAPPRGDTHADAVAMAERTRTILEYRKMGATLQAIADKFDLTPGRVSQIITAAIEALPKQSAEDVKMLELERCDAMQLALWPAALKGDIGAITTILSIMNRRARYLGLDVAEAVDATVVMRAQQDDARNALLSRLLIMKDRLEAAGPALPPPASTQ